MPNIQVTSPLSIETELGKLDKYKYSPSSIVQVSLNRLTDMLDGKVTIMEPSNPFTYLIETTSLNTAFAVQEFALLTRKLYPRLANTDKDLYLHMSDYDYVGRFSEPAKVNVTITVLFSNFKSLAKYDTATKQYVLKLPRHLKVTIKDYIFMLSSAVIIRLHNNDVVDIRYENQNYKNIFPITNNYINFNRYTLFNEEEYISFQVPMQEIDIEVVDKPITKGTLYHDIMKFNKKRKFYFLRAYYYKNDKWNEMLVTHTNEVYDIDTPTCLISVNTTDSEIEYSIPSIYINTNKISNNIRFLIYTTNGYIGVDFGDYNISDFVTEYGDVFPKEEMDEYTEPLQVISKTAFIKDTLYRGKDGLSFKDLKKAVIDNSIGDRFLPITTKQLEFYASSLNFKLIKDVDVVTGRVYKLETEIPEPKTRYPVTKHNMDIIELRTTIDALRQGNSVKAYNDNITVIPEGTVFKLVDGVMHILSDAELEQIQSLTSTSLIAHVNTHKLLSCYYHYVLDTTGNTAKLRAYDLNKPEVIKHSFSLFNQTARVSINTTTSNLYKTPYGYNFDVLANLKIITPSIQESNLSVYLVYTDVEGSKFYLESTVYTHIANQPVYRFEMKSDYFIFNNNYLHIVNFRDSNNLQAPINITLISELELIYVSNVLPTGFKSTEADSRIYGSYMGNGTCVVTLESVKVKFGNKLERLYAAMHTSVGADDYKRYDTDVLATYDKTVYNSSNVIVHHVGDTVLADDGTPVIKHSRGDVKLDEYGNPEMSSSHYLIRYLNLLLIDYRAMLTTSQLSKDYVKQIREYLTSVTLNNAVDVQEQLLDNTESYVVVPKTAGYVHVKTHSTEKSIPSSQSFKYTVFVPYTVYSDATIRDSVTYQIVKFTDNYLSSNTILKKTELLDQVYTGLKDFVISVKMDSFTQIDEEYIELVDLNSRISINKLLVAETNGYGLKEDVEVQFKLIN